MPRSTAVRMGRVASFAVTEDGGGGFQLFVGPGCEDRVDAAALTGSWIIALLQADRPLQGETVARLNDLKQGRQSICPSRLNAAVTRWYVTPFRYRAAEGQGAPITLATLISEHYGGEHPETADHVERFYFTRELGSTRWRTRERRTPPWAARSPSPRRRGSATSRARPAATTWSCAGPGRRHPRCSAARTSTSARTPTRSTNSWPAPPVFRRKGLHCSADARTGQRGRTDRGRPFIGCGGSPQRVAFGVHPLA